MTMVLLEWNDDYLIGVEGLDWEHKDLFNHLNEMHEELARHSERTVISAILGEIYTRLLAHFALEERYMLDTKFANYARHKREHDAFLNVVGDIIEDFRANPEPTHGDVLKEQLRNWILHHISTSDQDLALAQVAE